MANKPIQQRVEELLSQNVSPVAMAQFGKNCVCVYDNWGEWVIFFDASGYRMKNPDSWWADSPEVFVPPELKESGLGMLRGAYFNPALRGFYNAFDAAKDVLKPAEPEKWFEQFEVLYQKEE